MDSSSPPPPKPSRRHFLSQSAALAAASLPLPLDTPPAFFSHPFHTEISSLTGEWFFRLDPHSTGETSHWHAPNFTLTDWLPVRVPHTWQVDPTNFNYRGLAWYRRTFDAPPLWQNSVVRIEFEAVYHSAKIWINGQLSGEHLGKPYTAFSLDISSLLLPGQPNSLAVLVDNSFNSHMLPRDHSSDWALDGGIYRPVQLLITPKVYLHRIDVDALPDLSAPTAPAKLDIALFARNAAATPFHGMLSLRVSDLDTGLPALDLPSHTSISIPALSESTTPLTLSLPHPKLWHFDHPHLYRLDAILSQSDAHANTPSQQTSPPHSFAVIFGVRKLEVKDASFYLNGERVKLAGVERMPGSNPDYGMAEPSNWIEHDHRDLKNLNCVFTRTHWPQDARVFDFCDRHGILIQTEVPAWGPDTFQGMTSGPDPDILLNGLDQLREMIARDRNHPSIFAWGLCNEIDGQNPPAFQFAKSLLAEAKRLDPHRLCSYASNTLEQTPSKDVAALMDFIEMNEYIGTWSPGTLESLNTILDAIHEAFPTKPLVISEYGYCACVPERPEDDARRGEILRSHNAVFRQKDFISGLIFFCYNDYRTHEGDRGLGPMQQRIHGVVDLLGVPKPSYEILRAESSPIDSLVITPQLPAFHITIRSRAQIPAYSLNNYKLRAIAYASANLPVELHESPLPTLAPGQSASIDLTFTEPAPASIRFDVLRPTGFSAISLLWHP
jgi:beta-galactosidase